MQNTGCWLCDATNSTQSQSVVQLTFKNQQDINHHVSPRALCAAAIATRKQLLFQIENAEFIMGHDACTVPARQYLYTPSGGNRRRPMRDIHNVINQHLSKNSSTPVSMASKSGGPRARERLLLLVSLHSLVGMLFFLLCSPRAAVYNNVTAALMIVHPQTNSKNNTKQSSQPASARWKERRRPREALQVKRRLAEHQRKIIISLAHVRINHTHATLCLVKLQRFMLRKSVLLRRGSLFSCLHLTVYTRDINFLA